MSFPISNPNRDPKVNTIVGKITLLQEILTMGMRQLFKSSCLHDKIEYFSGIKDDYDVCDAGECNGDE